MQQNGISTERKTFILVGVLFLNLILISTNVVLENRKSLLQNILGSLASPFQIGFQKTVDFFSYELQHYVFLKNAYERYARMKDKQYQLKLENYYLRRQIENQAFLNKAKKLSKNFIEADVVSVDRNFPLNSVIIDKGSRNGVKSEMIVLNTDSELVGKIVEPITPFTAKVRLITSSVGGVGAYLSKNKLEGLLTGDNSSICIFKYLIENKPVLIGDQIVTSGTDEIFPPFIPIGKVVHIEKEYLIQNVYVKPDFLGKSIKKLLIINGPNHFINE